MKKIAIIVMVLVLALAAIGVGYAGFTDRVRIEGTVDVADVNLELMSVSGSTAFKDLSGDELRFYRWFDNLDGAGRFYKTLAGWTTVNIEDDWMQIADSGVAPVDDDYVHMYFNNIFPLPAGQYDNPATHEGWWKADVWWVYHGIPAKVNELIVPQIEIPDGIHIEYIFQQWRGPGEGEPIGNVGLGIQLHDGDKIQLVVRIWVDQVDSLQAFSAGGDVYLGVIQWNEVD